MLCSIASAATLNVGSNQKYKTIQSAVNAAHDGDTIKVASGTYKETVTFQKGLTILGTNYPKVNGFYAQEGGGGGIINGFSIQKDGVSSGYAGECLIRNNYFYNCGVDIWGGPSGGSTIMNNQITGGTISLYDTGGITITGNTISKSKCGLSIGDSMRAPMPTVSKNTFKNCNYGVYIYSDIGDPGKLTTFSGNKYIGNKVNIGWGTKSF